MTSEIYLALEIYNSFDTGEHTTVLGVYSSPAKALEALKSSTWWDRAEKLNDGLYRAYHGQDSVDWIIEPIDLDKLRGY